MHALWKGSSCDWPAATTTVIISSDDDYDAAETEMLRRGPCTVDEDALLAGYVAAHGEGRWNELARAAGLRRTGKSCRLRWLNYLRPGVRRGDFTPREQLLLLDLHSRWGNRWSKIAAHLPGRTDNEVKNYWRTNVFMGCPRPREVSAIVFMAFLLAGQALVSCHQSPTAAAKHHQAAHIRNKLLNDARATSGNSHGAVAMAYAASVDLCSEEVVDVSQSSASSLPNSIPSYGVTITNTCLDCTVRNVHVSCGEFASTELVDPSDFRRLSYNDCLVKNGGPIGPTESISFDYSNSFMYKMNVATVSCGDI